MSLGRPNWQVSGPWAVILLGMFIRPHGQEQSQRESLQPTGSSITLKYQNLICQYEWRPSCFKTAGYRGRGLPFLVGNPPVGTAQLSSPGPRTHPVEADWTQPRNVVSYPGQQFKTRWTPLNNPILKSGNAEVQLHG